MPGSEIARALYKFLKYQLPIVNVTIKLVFKPLLVPFLTASLRKLALRKWLRARGVGAASAHRHQLPPQRREDGAGWTVAGSTSPPKAAGRRTHSRSGLVPGRRGGTVGVELVMALGLHAFPVFPLVILAALMSLAGCGRPSQADAEKQAGQEIRSRIALIREAILARSASGIVASATPDWSFTGSDGVTLDRAGFIARTEALFARVLAIESLETRVDRITWKDPASAEVELTQTMVRVEQATSATPRVRLHLRYQEQHRWVRTAEGWRVQQVRFFGTPERTVLPPP
jgi:hypothetical protein